jgi:hypothetical protein
MFPIQNGQNKGDVLFLFLSNFASEYGIRKFQKNKTD